MSEGAGQGAHKQGNEIMNKKNFILLGAIVASMSNAATPYHMATVAEVAGLAKETPSMVETNDAIKDGDKVAVRATDAAIAFYKDEANKAKYDAPSAPRVKPEMTIGDGFVIPEGQVRQKAELYAFDTLAIGGFIFVPVSESKPDPFKSLASTVTAATKRYAHTVPGQTRIGRGGKSVPVTVNTRIFKLVSCKAGVAYGAFTAPSDGAAIVRAPDHVAETPAVPVTA